MLPKKNRLIKRGDFASVYAKGSYLAYGGISVKYFKSGLPDTRIGFSVGKNYSSKAVDRNRMKRILRMACLSHLKKLAAGYDIIIMARRQSKKPDAAEYSLLLGKIFKNAGLEKK